MLHTYLLILSIGLISICFLNIIGSIASRKFDFNFSYLSPFCLIIYLGISIWATKTISPIAGVTLAGLMGLFEATIGLKLIFKFNAKIEITADNGELLDENYRPHPNLVLAVVLVYMFVGSCGTLLV